MHGPDAVKILNELLDGPVVPEEAVFHVLGPRLQVARNLHVGVLLRGDVFHLPSTVAPGDSFLLSLIYDSGSGGGHRWSPVLLKALSVLAEALRAPY